MSAPDTNIEKQAKRHKPSLLGLAAAAAIPVLVILGLLWGNEMIGDDATDGTAIKQSAR